MSALQNSLVKAGVQIPVPSPTLARKQVTVSYTSLAGGQKEKVVVQLEIPKNLTTNLGTCLTLGRDEKGVEIGNFSKYFSDEKVFVNFVVYGTHKALRTFLGKKPSVLLEIQEKTVGERSFLHIVGRLLSKEPPTHRLMVGTKKKVEYLDSLFTTEEMKGVYVGLSALA